MTLEEWVGYRLNLGDPTRDVLIQLRWLKEISWSRAKGKGLRWVGTLDEHHCTIYEESYYYRERHIDDGEPPAILSFTKDDVYSIFDSMERMCDI